MTQNDLPLHEQFEDQCREVGYLKDKLAASRYECEFHRKAFRIFKEWMEAKYDKENPLVYRDQILKTLSAIDGVFAMPSPGVQDFDYDAFNEPIDFLKSFRTWLESKKNIWSQGKPIA